MFNISSQIYCTLCKGIKMNVEYQKKIDIMFSAGLGSPSSWVCVAALENGLESGQGSLQPWRPLSKFIFPLPGLAHLELLANVATEMATVMTIIGLAIIASER